MIKIIDTKTAPNCTGPYVQGIDAKRIIFISGQIGICPETNKMLDDIKQQTHQVLKNIEEIIKKSGTKIENIVKTTIFLTEIDNLDVINDIYKNFFNVNRHIKYPARSCIIVKNLPKNAKIEIEAIAFKD